MKTKSAINPQQTLEGEAREDINPKGNLAISLSHTLSLALALSLSVSLSLTLCVCLMH
jgi:hypothetical protein